MKDLEYFKEQSLARDLCSQYSVDIARCMGDKRKLFELSLTNKGRIYLATSIYDGWGMDIEYLKSEWADYINGKYKVNERGIFSSLYVDYNDAVVSDAYMSLIRCKSNITIPKCASSTIVVSNSSHVNLLLEDFNFVYLYLLDNSKVNIDLIPENSSVVCYRYSDECSIEVVERKGQFKETRKKLEL